MSMHNDSLPQLPPAAQLSDLEPIGRGGFASVFSASDRAHGRRVAVKVLDAVIDLDEMSETAGARFDRERETLGCLSTHPNIVTLLDSGRCLDGRPYLVMEQCAGGTLAQRIADGPIDWDEATRVVVGLAGALHTAHQAGVLHRDVKPENVMCGEFGEWKLGDFGVAASPSRRVTATGELVASIAHAAPETFSSDPSVPSRDTYGLASVLYTMLSGDEPFRQRDGEPVLSAIQRIASDDVAPLDRTRVPTRLAIVVEAAMVKDPARRYPSALAFGEALNSVRVACGLERVEMKVERKSASSHPTTRVIPFAAAEQSAAASERGRRHGRGLPAVAAAVVSVSAALATLGLMGTDAAIVTTEFALVDTTGPTETSVPAEVGPVEETVDTEPVPLPVVAPTGDVEAPPTPAVQPDAPAPPPPGGGGGGDQDGGGGGDRDGNGGGRQGGGRQGGGGR